METIFQNPLFTPIVVTLVVIALFPLVAGYIVLISFHAVGVTPKRISIAESNSAASSTATSTSVAHVAKAP